MIVQSSKQSGRTTSAALKADAAIKSSDPHVRA
jgi:hypothetical protein